MTLPVLPPQGSTNWYAHYAALDTGLRALAGSGRLQAGSRWVALGDSITAADAYLRFSVALSGGRVRLVRNAGVGGNTLQQMLDRFDTDVTPYAPTMVSVMAGTNDYTFGVTDAQFRTRVQQFVAKVRAISAVPLLFTSPPCNVLAAPDRAKIPRNNAWMADYAAREGVLLIDAYSALADPTGYGNFLPAYDNGDGTHPNDAGHYAIAAVASDAFRTLMAPVQPFAATNADPTNLLVNGLMKDADADGWADSWGQNWGLDSGTWTYSIVNDANVPGGTMQRMQLNGATGKVQRYQDITTGFAPGDVLRFSALVTNTANISASITLANNGTALDSRTFTRPFTRALADWTVTVPAGVTTLRVEIATQAIGSNITGSADYGALTLRNLTTLGIA